MKRPLLPCRPFAGDAGASDRGVELAAKDRRVGEVAAGLARKDKDVRLARASELAPPLAQERHYVLGERHVSRLVVLCTGQMTVRVGAADVEIAAGDVYVAPGERGKLAFSHPCLERDEEQRPIDALRLAKGFERWAGLDSNQRPWD